MSYTLRVYQTMSQSVNYNEIAHDAIISLSIKEEGNANSDPFEFVGSKAQVSIYAYPEYLFLTELDTADGFTGSRLFQVWNGSYPIFSGAVFLEDIKYSKSSQVIDITISDSVRLWIALSKNIDLDGGQYSMDALFTQPMSSGYGDLANNSSFPDGSVNLFSSTGVFSTDYAPYKWAFNSTNSDMFGSGDNPNEWAVASRQAMIIRDGERITRFFIIRKMVGSFIDLRLKWQSLKIDVDRLVQGIYTLTEGVIDIPRQAAINNNTLGNYIRNELASEGALAGTETFSVQTVTEFENGENPTNPNFNPGDSVTSTLPIFAQTQTYDYSSGERLNIDKYGKISGRFDLNKQNLICKEGSLSQTVKAFLLLLGYGMKAKATGGIEFYPHIIKEFTTAAPIAISDNDLIEKNGSGLIADFQKALSSLDIFEYEGRNNVKRIMLDKLRQVYNTIAFTVAIMIPRSYYDNNVFTGFAKITIEGNSYYALNWTVPIYEDVFVLNCIGEKI